MQKELAPAGAEEVEGRCPRRRSRVSGSFRAVITFPVSVLLLPLRLLPRRKAGFDAPVDAERTLSLSERQRESSARRVAAAKHELKSVWRASTNVEERKRATRFFNCLADPSWRLESHSPDTRLETWRLTPPGAKIHTVMGAITVDAAPKVALSIFEDRLRVLTHTFRVVDPMYQHGAGACATGVRSRLFDLF